MTHREQLTWLIVMLTCMIAIASLSQGHELPPEVQPFINAEMHEAMHTAEAKQKAIQEFAANWLEPNIVIEPEIITMTGEINCTDVDDDDLALMLVNEPDGMEVLANWKHNRYYIIWDRSIDPTFPTIPQHPVFLCCTDGHLNTCKELKIDNPQPVIPILKMKDFAKLHERLFSEH